jgi:predicted N-acetyltransferase YhbS
LLYELDDAAIDQAAEHTHSLWGGGLPLELYAQALRQQALRSEGILQLVGMLEGGQLVSWMKRYRLRLHTPAGARACVGVGALFTRGEARRRGHAQRLVKAVLQSEGAATALLFSDVGADFYRRLGFEPLEAASYRVDVAALPPADDVALAPMDLSEALELGERAATASWRMARDETSLRYFAWRHGDPEWWRIELRGQPLGYAAVRPKSDPLWLEDVAVLGDAHLEVWGAIRRLAERHGSERIRGWLRPGYGRRPWQRMQRSGCLPMLARLQPGLPPLGSCFFAPIDRF